MVQQSSWREGRYALPPKEITTITFFDTKPNHIYIANNSPLQVYFGIAAVSASTFDMIIPSMGTRLWARDMGVSQFNVYNDTDTEIQIYVQSWIGEFNPSSLSQTQEIITNTAAGLLGIMDIRNLLNPLPPGTNHIGSVTVENEAAVSDYTSILNLIQANTAAKKAISAADGDIVPIGAKGDAAVTDPTLQASQIALLKGLLKQMQGNGAGQQNVQLMGSNAMDAVAITPNDGVDLATKPTKGIYLGVSGDVKITLNSGNTVTFTNLSSGVIHPIAAKRIWATGTTATSILAVY